VFLNALPLNAIPYNEYTVVVKKYTFDQLLNDFKIYSKHYNITATSYIRHPTTVKVLNEVLSEVSVAVTINQGLYEYRESDIVYVITLKQQKVERGKEVTELTKDDLDIYSVMIYKGII